MLNIAPLEALLDTALLQPALLDTALLDTAPCEQVSPTKLWTMFSTKMGIVLSRPQLLIPLLLVLLLLIVWRLWSAKRFRRKKPTAVFVSTLGLVTLLLASPVLETVGGWLLTRPIPADSGETADAIVILGRGRRQNDIRGQTATNLWRAQRAPLIFPSGRLDAPQIAEKAKALDVPESAIAGDACSLTTHQNAAFTAALLWPKGVRKIILVTDSLHMLRSLLTFKSFGFQVIPHIVPFKTDDHHKSRFIVFRESLGLLTYGMMGRYFAREAPPAYIIYPEISPDPPEQVESSPSATA
ncbi:MAG: YdcF family protein [Cyanobacteria bacterium J06597_16]